MATRVLSTIVCSNFWPHGYTLCISGDGNVYSIGKHSKGGLGFQEELIFPPKVIPSLQSIVSINCGNDHTVCLDMEGCVFTLGSNEHGQLGVGQTSQTLEFTHIPQKLQLPRIQQISSGYGFTICLSNDGELYSFGQNIYGQLGLGDNEESNSPKKIESLKNVEFVECGGYYIICKTIDNNIYGWGFNLNGQLGIRNYKNQTLPVKCEHWPLDLIIDIKCGKFHTLVLTSKQEVYSFGDNEFSQLGRDSKPTTYTNEVVKISSLSNIVRIECGTYHSVCINNTGDLYVFGRNKQGQLGLGNTNGRSTPVKHPSISNIIDVSSKGNQTFVKTISKEICAFGNNEYSQLGIETKNNSHQITPIRVFEDNEDIWCSNIFKSKAKSARSSSKTK